MGLRQCKTTRTQILSQPALPFKAWFHSFLHPSINLPIFLLALLRLLVIVTIYMKIVTKDCLCLTIT